MEFKKPDGTRKLDGREQIRRDVQSIVDATKRQLSGTHICNKKPLEQRLMIVERVKKEMQFPPKGISATVLDKLFMPREQKALEAFVTQRHKAEESDSQDHPSLF